MWTNAISISIGVVCLIIALVLWVIGRHLQILVLCLVITGTAGILHTFVGDGLTWVVNWGNNQLAGVQWGNITVSLVLGILAVVCTYVVFMDVVHHLANKPWLPDWLRGIGGHSKGITGKTLFAGMGMPLFGGSIGGWGGSVITWVLSCVTQGIAWCITAGFGIH